MQKLKELIKLSSLCNSQLFASNIEGNISHQKLWNCLVVKMLMSHTFSVKFRVFRRECLRNHSVYWAQIFRDNWNCYALLIFRVYILLASSGSNKHNVYEAKSAYKDSAIPTLSNDPGKMDSNFFCYAATVLSPHRNVLIFTQRMHKPTWRPFTQ